MKWSWPEGKMPERSQEILYDVAFVKLKEKEREKETEREEERRKRRKRKRRRNLSLVSLIHLLSLHILQQAHV